MAEDVIDLPVRVPDTSPDVELNLLVLIVCFRAADLTVDCLRTLVPQVREIPGARVAVCENGTGPESVARIEAAIEGEGWGDRVGMKVIAPNRGFAGGNNAVLAEVMAWPKPPRYVLLLNSETLLHRPGTLLGMYRAIEERADVGVLGPRVEWKDGGFQNTTYRYRTPLTELLVAARTGPLSALLPRHQTVFPIPDGSMDPDWLTFACAIIRREVLQHVGLLDAGFYLYFDDLDYCRRARDAGWRVHHFTGVSMIHLRGQSNPLKSLAAERKRRPRYFYASRARYYAKFYGIAGLWLANLLWNIGRVVSLIREFLGKKDPHVCEMEWRDIWTNWQDPLKPPERKDAQS